jgi:anti-sigma B factor antagonist
MSFFYCSDVISSAHCVDGVIVAASGEFDYEASPRLRACVFGHIRAGRRHLVVDLSDVTFIDSTAIGVLMGAAMWLRELGGGSLAVVCADENERVLRIFDIAGVAVLIALHRSRGQALRALAAAHVAEPTAWAPQTTASGTGSESCRLSGRAAAWRYRKQALASVAAPDAALAAGRGRGIDELA